MRIIVPYPPGSSYDTVSRVIGEALNESLGQPFIVDNRIGASGTIGVNLLAQADTDGHTIGVFGNNQLILPAVSTKPPYDLARDLAPLGIVALIDSVIVINPSLPAKNLRELVALFKASPGKYRYGSGGIASSSHLMSAMFASMTGVELLHVPYRGGSLGIVALMGNEVQMQVTTLVNAKPLINSGKLRGMAVASHQRTPFMPEMPTAAEAGLPGYEFMQWFSMFAPAKTPATLLTQISSEIGKTVEREKVRARFAGIGAHPHYQRPVELAALIRRETAAFRKVARESGIELR